MAISTLSQTSPGARSERALERALAAARTAAENRGRDIIILDLRSLTSEFDYFVVATGSSGRQMRAISEEIDHTLKHDMHDRRLGVEGSQARRYYALDELWCEAKRVPFEMPAADRLHIKSDTK